MATIGSLVVDMRANTAQFEADIGRSRTSLQRTGAQMKSTQEAAVRFASKGFGEIIGASAGVERALESLMRTAFSATRGFLMMGGQLAIIVTGTLAVAAAVQKLRDLIGQKVFGLESEEQRLEKMKAAVEEEQKFQKIRLALGAEERQLRQDILQSQLEASAAFQKSIGDEAGARETALQAELAGIEAARAAEIRKITELGATGEQRRQLETLANQKALNERVAAQTKAAVDLQRIEAERSAKLMQTWARETEVFIADLERRHKIRQDIEARAAAAAERLGIAEVLSQFKKVEELKKGAQEVAAGFALMLDKGVPLRDLLPEMAKASAQFGEKVRAMRQEAAGSPAVLDKMDRELSDISWGDFITLTEQARVSMQNARVDTASLAADTHALNQRIGEMPIGINRAVPEIDKLVGRFRLIQMWADAAARSVNNLDIVIDRSQ
jgi:hypothetical protein